MDKLHFNEHISKRFNEDLEDLKSQLLEMGGVVEQQTINAVKAIIGADSDLAEKVIAVEDDVDKREVNLDEQCTLVLARRQPAASDLRMVVSVIKITRDLERMGDEAQKIAKMAIQLTESGASPHGYVEIRHIAAIVQQMVNDTLDAFARYDVAMALKVAKQDKTVDQEYASAMREMATFMMEDPRSISRVMNVIWALRALERIGDHAMNIAEHVIYLVEGLDVRHNTASEIEEQLAKR
jgi:phosphate transport system protein